MTQRSPPASRGRPAHRGKDSGAHTAECSASERFWTRSSPHREGHSRQQAPWSPRQALQARGMSPGTGSSWQVRGDNFQGVGRDWRRRDWLVSGGDRALRGDRGLVFRPEGRGQRSRGGWGPQPQETLHELELVRGGKTSTAVGFMSYSLLSRNC